MIHLSSSPSQSCVPATVFRVLMTVMMASDVGAASLAPVARPWQAVAAVA